MLLSPFRTDRLPTPPRRGLVQTLIILALSSIGTQRLSHGADGLVSSFAVCDWDLDGKPDLAYISRAPGLDLKCSVRILSASSDYQKTIGEVTPAITPHDGFESFLMRDWDKDGRPDLISIQQSRDHAPDGLVSRARKGLIQIFSGATNFATRLVEFPVTQLPTSSGCVSFDFCDRDRDSIPDLACVTQDRETGAGLIRFLSGASGFQVGIGQYGTHFAAQGEQSDHIFVYWDSDDLPDLVNINVLSSELEIFVVNVHAGSDFYAKCIYSETFSNKSIIKFGASSPRASVRLASDSRDSSPIQETVALYLDGDPEKGPDEKGIDVADTCIESVAWKTACVKSIGKISKAKGKALVAGRAVLAIATCSWAGVKQFQCAVNAGKYVNSLSGERAKDDGPAGSLNGGTPPGSASASASGNTTEAGRAGGESRGTVGGHPGQSGASRGDSPGKSPGASPGKSPGTSPGKSPGRSPGTSPGKVERGRQDIT